MPRNALSSRVWKPDLASQPRDAARLRRRTSRVADL